MVVSYESAPAPVNAILRLLRVGRVLVCRPASFSELAARTISLADARGRDVTAKLLPLGTFPRLDRRGGVRG